MTRIPKMLLSLVVVGAVAPGCASGAGDDATDPMETTASATEALAACGPGEHQACAFDPEVRRVVCECVRTPPPPPPPPACPAPISGPLQRVVVDSGPLGPSTVSGWAQVALQSDGTYAYRGHVHESGALGHDYLFGMSPSFRDANGRAFAVAREGTIHGTFDIGSRDDDWFQAGCDPTIAANWGALSSSAWSSRLHVATNPIAAVEATLAGLGIAAGATAVVLLGGSGGWHCDPGIFDPGPGGGIGVEGKCRKEW